ncbi:[acyl-carrier-protein] S-malonyltransferase [Coprococcus sp. AM14-16]|uniref:ACP S-malonyltransferase n=1 Tax=Coprococcus TaxID=33042 RepID=UPI000E41B54C|nr:MULTISPECIES: ACP S-malonyltransferase [Coprococcus]RGD40182.1 [acyl-carrier-protein] S-malonyltransferase [Coprococcus sp. AM14-16]
MGKTAVIFPGQGAQYVGMAKDFYDSFEDSKKVFDEADDVLDIELKKICFEENDDINKTEYTQPAMVAAEVAIYEHLKNAGLKADVFAGLSLGEYSALVAAGAMTLADGIKTVRRRGILMQNEVPLGMGGMAAVIAMDADKIAEVCENTPGKVQIANYNCPGQIVISGEAEAVKAASAALAEAGAKRVIPLNVSGPFHSQMLVPAGEKLYDFLQGVDVAEGFAPYYCNADAEEITDAAKVKELLKRQVYSSVRWQQTIENMIADGVDTFIEVGPGKTLTGFMKKINREVKSINIATVDDLAKLEELNA